MDKKRGRGQPTRYNAELHPQFANALAALGLIEVEIATKMRIGARTLATWKKVHPEFRQALKVGKIDPDDRVERSLYERAVGYYYNATKIMNYKGQPIVVKYVEHCPPDTVACIFWLKNRRRKEWRDRWEITGDDGGPLQIQYVDQFKGA